MIYIEMDTLGFICLVILVVLPSLMTAVALFIGSIQDIKNAKRKKELENFLPADGGRKHEKEN